MHNIYMLFIQRVFYIKCIYVVGTCIVWGLYIYTHSFLTYKAHAHYACSNVWVALNSNEDLEQVY